jgi:hypothetical protein
MLYTAACTLLHSSVCCEIPESLTTDFGVHNVGKVDKGKVIFMFVPCINSIKALLIFST